MNAVFWLVVSVCHRCLNSVGGLPSVELILGLALPMPFPSSTSVPATRHDTHMTLPRTAGGQSTEAVYFQTRDGSAGCHWTSSLPKSSAAHPQLSKRPCPLPPTHKFGGVLLVLELASYTLVGKDAGRPRLVLCVVLPVPAHHSLPPSPPTSSTHIIHRHSRTQPRPRL